MKKMRYTLMDLQKDFPTEDACLEWLKDFIYPEGIVCPNENKITPHHKLTNRKAYSCELCGHHVYPAANTIFHKSSTSLTKWMYAIYLMSATRSGISAKQLERELGVTYKTAWRMFHQIRKMLASNEQLTGEVEVDETYFSPNPQRKKSVAKLSTKMKAENTKIVFGAVERNGKARVRHIPTASLSVLVPAIRESVQGGSTIYSDEWRAYAKLSVWGYNHQTIKHKDQEFVNGKVHTQNIENLWMNMKLGIKGVYRHVDNKYLQNYIDEYAFRYSHRNDFQSMFWAMLNRVST
jgi:transposase